jgi:hypothetical protein
MTIKNKEVFLLLLFLIPSSLLFVFRLFDIFVYLFYFIFIFPFLILKLSRRSCYLFYFILFYVILKVF